MFTRRLAALTLLGMLCANTAFAAVPNDPLISRQWYLDKIQAYTAWDTQTGTNDVVVAVLDTGLDFDHPDLAANLWRNEGEVPGDGIDNDKNGFVDDTNGWDFVDGDNSPIPSTKNAPDEDAVFHGTVVAGIIGAVGNNGEGIAGVMWKTKIMPVRILDQFGSGTSQSARLGIEYAVANHADVINLSFTGFDVDEVFRDVVRRAYEAGVTIVASVGNKGGGGVNMDETPVYPACFTGTNGDDWVIGVAATTLEDTKATFSNYGSTCTDISAPGVDVFGTSFQDVNTPGFTEAYLGGWAGTSVSSPIVAGAAALLIASYPTITPTQIKTALQLSVDPISRDSAHQGQLGAGRLNLARAMEVAKGIMNAAPLPPPAPTGSATSVPSGSTRIVLAAAVGQPPVVDVYDQRAVLTASFFAYAEGFKGGVRVAVGDVDGDGEGDIITAAGPGGGPHVRVFSLAGQLKGQFFAMETTDRHGLFVGTADLDGDGKDEILTGPDADGSGEVRAFRLNGEQVLSFRPFDGAKEGLRVAGIDRDGDGRSEIAVSRGVDAAPEVRLFTNAGVFDTAVTAYAPTFTRGVFIASGDLNGDGTDELVTGPGVGGGPQVRAFFTNGTVAASFFAFSEQLRTGALVATGRLGGTQDAIISYENGRLALRDRVGANLGDILVPNTYGALAAGE